jgi:hypothetical protein
MERGSNPAPFLGLVVCDSRRDVGPHNLDGARLRLGVRQNPAAAKTNVDDRIAPRCDGTGPPGVPTITLGDESPMNHHQGFPRGRAAELRGQDEVACGSLQHAPENGPKYATKVALCGARVAGRFSVAALSPPRRPAIYGPGIQIDISPARVSPSDGREDAV